MTPNFKSGSGPILGGLCQLGKNVLSYWVFYLPGFTSKEATIAFWHWISSVQCPTLWDPMNRSTPGLPVQHHLPEFTQTHVQGSMMPSSHLILGRPFLLLPPIPPSIRIFSNESALHMRWPKYWSFSFSIIISNIIYLSFSCWLHLVW